ncbi:MAG: InlB B-repeat-containing protein, partial [Alphaproteobacteria bacterium]|nr:InlB B-repeat-containing protein [Alphaproteobacteria bacterium]
DTEATTGGTQYYTSAGASARSWNKAAATTLYARWKGNTITINYVENGGTELSNITCTYGESFKLPTISRSGYSFAGWAFGDTSSSESMTKFKAGATVICDYKNLKVYSGTADAQAMWNIVGYAITYKDGDNEISGLTPTLYDVETEINLPTVAYKEGKKFVSWHTDSALSESTVVNTIPKGSTGDKTFYVKWEDCPAGYACNGSSVTQCTGPTYAVAGSASCSSCPSGYTYDTTKGKTKAEQCKIRCAGGSYLAKAKDASCTNVGAKYYKVAHIVNYNSASSRSA